MYKLVLFFVLSFISANLSAQKNCKYYKVGNFTLSDKGLGISYRIERSPDKQIETDLKTGKITIFNVKWNSECEYELSVVSGTSEMVAFYKGKILVVRLLEIYGDGYKFEGHIKGTTIFKTQILKLI
jgi:hypothetical protein